MTRTCMTAQIAPLLRNPLRERLAKRQRTRQSSPRYNVRAMCYCTIMKAVDVKALSDVDWQEEAS